MRQNVIFGKGANVRRVGFEMRARGGLQGGEKSNVTLRRHFLEGCERGGGRQDVRCTRKESERLIIGIADLIAQCKGPEDLARIVEQKETPVPTIRGTHAVNALDFRAPRLC